MSVNSPRMRYPAELPTGTEVASYTRYEDAAVAVDTLEKAGFPISSVTIAGSDLHMVEKVMGKLTPARVALTGAGQGLTWGLLMGLISILALPQGGSIVAMIAIAMGVLAGVLISVVVWATNSRRRTYFSQSTVVASRYAVLVAEQADRAHNLLSNTQGNVPPKLRQPTRLTQVARPPRTYSEAQREATGEDREPTKRTSLEPPKYGVRLSDEQNEESVDSKSGSGEPEPGDNEPAD